MLRADNTVCGTSTTGTGTLTPAACPSPPGGIDFFVWLTTTGIGFTNPADVLVSYTIIEYTDSTFATAKQTEKGIGTLQVRGSLTASALVRTKVQVTGTSLNTGSPSMTVSAPSAINIGTAANTLIFIGASAIDVPGYGPFFATASVTNSDFLVPPLGTTAGAIDSGGLANNTFYYGQFVWGVPMLAKRAAIFMNQAYTGGTTNGWIRLYDFASDGRPGKLLYDFGLVGTAGTTFNVNSPTAQKTGASGNGFLMTPGDYCVCLGVTFSGGAGAPSVFNSSGIANLGRWGTGSLSNNVATGAGWASASGTPSSTPDDPAVLTSFATNPNGVHAGLTIAFAAS